VSDSGAADERYAACYRVEVRSERLKPAGPSATASFRAFLILAPIPFIGK